MAKNSKRKLLLITAILTVLLSSAAFTTLLPKARAAEITAQEKGLSILNDVIGFNLTKYDVTTEEYSKEKSLSYLNVIPQENVAYDLTSEDSKLKTFCTFADGNLQMMYVLEREETPSPFKPTTNANVVKLAEDFLGKYQTYTANPLFGELKTTLDNVDACENLTKTSGNTVLEVTAVDGYTNFKWYYTANGAVAPYSKFVALIFEDGFLVAFVDNWQLYDVGSTSVSLSEEEAVAIALEAAKAHCWSLTLEDDALDAENFNESNVRWTALLLDGSLNADRTRSEDPLALYPVWRVGIALDKWYGYMYGIQVDIWADTKEVRRVQEAWSTMPPPEGIPTANFEQESLPETNDMAMLMIPACIIVAVLFALVWIGKKKKALLYNLHKKHRSFKAGGILLCILISSTLFLGAVATVNATSRGAVVWGSESTGAEAYPNCWRKHYLEIDAQRNAAENLTVFFSNGGYTGNNGINHQGVNNPGSNKSQILSDLYTLQENNDYVAVVDFDHGVGRDDYAAAPLGEFHYMFEDNTGTITGPWEPIEEREEHPENGVYDMDIFGYTQPDQLIFAFISTCMSADLSEGQGYLEPQWPPYTGRALGMPYAWTGRLVKDKSVTQDFTINEHISDDGYADPDWGRQVYIGFIGGSPSLSQALAPYSNPYYYWLCSFLGHALCYDQSVNAALNTASVQFMGCSFSGTELRTGFTPWWWNMTGDWDTSYMGVYGNGNMHLRYYTAPADAATPEYVTGPASEDVSVSCEFSAFAGDPYGHNVKYRFDWDDGSPYTETGWYSDGEIASANHSWSSAGSYNVRIQALCPNSGWSSWSSPHNILIGETYQLTMLAVNQYNQPGYVPLYIDSEYVGTTGYTYIVFEGNHQIYVESPLYGGGYHVFACYYYDGGYNYNNPMTLSVTEDKTVYACYYTY